MGSCRTARCRTSCPLGLHPGAAADALARLITVVDAGRATVLGSSGGAVTALALVQARPELVRTVIAHEPPLIDLLDDREQLRAETEEQASHLPGRRRAGAWRLVLRQPGSSCRTTWYSTCSAASGTRRRWPTSTSGSHTGCGPRRSGDPTWPRSGRRRPASWSASERTPQASCATATATATALAAALGIEPARFPSPATTGFVDDPAAFAIRLREVLGSSAALGRL